jgi:hypothetical protein
LNYHRFLELQYGERISNMVLMAHLKNRYCSQFRLKRSTFSLFASFECLYPDSAHTWHVAHAISLQPTLFIKFCLSHWVTISALPLQQWLRLKYTNRFIIILLFLRNIDEMIVPRKLHSSWCCAIAQRRKKRYANHSARPSQLTALSTRPCGNRLPFVYATQR